MNGIIIFKPDSPLELILPGVNINGSGDSLAIHCRCCWSMSAIIPILLYTDEELKAAIEKLSEGGPPN
jgi:hypothetical protein